MFKKRNIIFVEYVLKTRFEKGCFFTLLFSFSVDMAFNCKECGQSFDKPSQLATHRRTDNHWRDHKCDTCGKCFGRADNLERHRARHRDFRQHECLQCSMVFTRSDSLARHIRIRHQQGGGVKRKHDEHDEAPDEKCAKIDDPKNYYSMKKTRQVKMRKFNNHVIYVCGCIQGYRSRRFTGN